MFIHGAYVFANFDTKVTFSPPESIVKVEIGLEENLGSPNNTYFFSGSGIYRITPTSGLYVNYYGMNRSKNSYTDKDIYWAGDTIPAGTNFQTYFKTNVFSAGYILSILKDPDSCLGAYLNFYVMPLSLGFRTESDHNDYHLGVVLPLPNIGLVAMFKLTQWLSVGGNVGFFSLYTESFGGYIHDLSITFPVRVTKWLKLSLNYQKFVIHSVFPKQKINTYVDYDFNGPSVGFTLKF